MTRDGQPIGGEYQFGDLPPHYLMGWAGIDEERRALDNLASAGLVRSFAEAFPVVSAAASPARSFVWDLAKKLFNGSHLPTPTQETGDCTAVADAVEANFTQIVQIVEGYREQRFRAVFAPFTYYASRVLIGQNRIRGAGSTGAWTAAAANKIGRLFVDDEGVPAYSGSLADAWGNGRAYSGSDPRDFQATAKDNPTRYVVQLKTVAEIREALLAHKPCTIASNRGFGMQPVRYKDRHVFQPAGSWAHQMTFLDWMDDPFPAAYRGNQWGAKAHGDPLNGEWPGGAWNLADDIEAELRTGVEVYCFAEFEGEPGSPDFRLVR